MAWNMTPVQVSDVTSYVDWDEIPQDILVDLEAAYEHCRKNPGDFLRVPFETEEAKAEAKLLVRSFAYNRPTGRLTANVRQDDSEEDFALLIRFTNYVKRNRARGKAA